MEGMKEETRRNLQGYCSRQREIARGEAQRQEAGTGEVDGGRREMRLEGAGHTSHPCSQGKLRKRVLLPSAEAAM